MKCPNGGTPQVAYRVDGKPGSCCDVYQCSERKCSSLLAGYNLLYCATMKYIVFQTAMIEFLPHIHRSIYISIGEWGSLDVLSLSHILL